MWKIKSLGLGFLKLISGFEVDDPRKVLYVGDHVIKDVEASLRCGLQAVHVLNEDRGSDVSFGSMELNGDSIEYARARTIYNVGDVLRV